jgi:short-subunit dehydrogenase
VKELSGRHALVTGASRGIGRAIARSLVSEGMRVTLAARSAADLESLAAELGSSAVAVCADVASPADRERLASVAEEAFGVVDLLVNNAGVEFAADFSTQDPDEILRTLDVNLAAPMMLTRLLLPGMKSRSFGHVLNVASLAGKVASPYEAAYSASKYGLVGFSHALRAELRGTGVSVSVVCPGFVAGDGMYARMAGHGLRAMSISVSPLPRVARAVVSAVVQDRAEVVVNPVPLRPLFLAQALAPSWNGAFMDMAGVTKVFRKAAEARARRRG